MDALSVGIHTTNPENVGLQVKMVPRKGLEPPQPYDRQHLKLVRLPISPPGHAVIIRDVP